MFRIQGNASPNGSRQVFKVWSTYPLYCKKMSDSLYLPELINFVLVDRKNNRFEVNKHTVLKKPTLFPYFILIYNTHIILDRHLERQIYTWCFKINYTFSGARARRWSIYHFRRLATVFEAVKVAFFSPFFFLNFLFSFMIFTNTMKFSRHLRSH